MLYQTKNPHGGDVYGREVLLDYSANTNPLGTPEGVLSAIRSSLSQLHRYPDPYCRELVGVIADFEDVSRQWILCGSGAAELIYSYCEAVGAKRAVELAPTFSEYSLALNRTGCQISRYNLSKENGFCLDGGFLRFLEQAEPEVVFLCNPNNPTGKTIEKDLIEQILNICREKGIRLFVDECFADLSDREQSLKPKLEEYPNVFILKAFTKSYGMAGIRLGYCLSADPELLGRMAKTVQPWNVSTVAQAAGVAALQEREFIRQTRELIARERPWLKQHLEQLGFWVCDSEANYLLFQGPEDLHIRLKERKIAIRNCDNYPGLGPGWYRIAVRGREENAVLMGTMYELLGKEPSWQKTL